MIKKETISRILIYIVITWSILITVIIASQIGETFDEEPWTMTWGSFFFLTIVLNMPVILFYLAIKIKGDDVDQITSIVLKKMTDYKIDK